MSHREILCCARTFKDTDIDTLLVSKAAMEIQVRAASVDTDTLY